MRLSRSLRAAAGVALVALASGCTALKRFAYEGFDRDRWQHPARVVETLGIEPGDRIVDLGAGSGYFTFRLADATGEDGIVYAVDTDAGLVGYLRERAAAEGRRNVQAVAVAPDRPRLPAGAIDLVFTCNTYHHLRDRPAYFARLLEALTPGGRVAIIEYRAQGLLAGLFGHSTGEDTIRREMEAAGYRLAASYDFLPRQSFQVFTAASTPPGTDR